MSTPRHRTIRLELAIPMYEALEESALERDVGATDMIRHVLVEWLRNNPPGSAPTPT